MIRLSIIQASLFMSLTKEDTKNIAHLARLALADDEIEQYSKDLSNILELVAKMETINTDHVAPMAHPMALTQRLREDNITASDQHELFQTLAPSVEDDLYLVPKVIE